MSETLASCCADHGVTLNAEHVEAVGKLFDGTLLKKLLALLQKFGPSWPRSCRRSWPIWRKVIIWRHFC